MGGGSGKYKTRNVLRVLEYFARLHPTKILFERASKEGYKIKPIFGGDICFPIPSKHSTISTPIVEGAGKRLEKWGVCTKEEFLERVK
jgi:hypothetical protein